MKYAKLVEHLVKNIVSEPDSVEVETTQERDGAVYYVTVEPNDVGKMIGKNGRVITAIRHVASAAAAKGQQKAYVKINTD